MESGEQLTMTVTFHADGSVRATAPERVPGPRPLP
jgi:hypothetical protein